MKGTGDRKCKFEQIRDHLETLLQKHPDYKICTRGHSSGSALATLFAFFLAADDWTPKPVTVISIASPRVGNIRFSHAFQELEIHGRLQHIRVANRKDVVRWKSLT
jgi:predicted lipase